MKQKGRGCVLVIIALLAAAQLAAQDTTFTNRIGMQFRLIPSGSFVMGRFNPPYPTPAKPAANATQAYSPAHYQLAKTLAEQDATPGFTATITKPFYIGVYEVTQAQWTAVMHHNPSTFQQALVTDDAGQHPVENISWQQAQRFLQRLNALEKGRHYRLPTEAEWEWAARAGAASDIPWAGIRQTAQLGRRTTALVGGKQPNAWGLYDMLGNVWEWVQDFYNEKLFADKAPPKKGTTHVLKGASFVGDVKNATYLTHAAGPGNGWDVGFRVVLEIH